jgi:hypothetical protein
MIMPLVVLGGSTGAGACTDPGARAALAGQHVAGAAWAFRQRM